LRHAFGNFPVGSWRKTGIKNMETVEKQDRQEGFVSVSGGKVWYEIIGADKTRPPLLVLHGGPGAPHDYLEPLEALADERPVVFYDQLGCGRSDTPDDASLWGVERFVEEVGKVRQAIGLEKVHIIGQSWGASLAVEYLLATHPEGVASLVLSGPFLSASRWVEDQKAYLLELPEEIQEVIRKTEASGDFQSDPYQEAVMRYYQLHVCRLEPWPDCLNRTMEKFGVPVYEQMWGPSEFSVTGTLKDHERVEALKKISVPVLFTCGRYDEATPVTTEYYRSNLPGSEICIFEEASHEHHLERPEEYLKVVREFLNRAERR
jgi:proline iminopeptidase